MNVSAAHLRLRNPFAWTKMDCNLLSDRVGQAVPSSGVVCTCIAAAQVASVVASALLLQQCSPPCHLHTPGLVAVRPDLCTPWRPGKCSITSQHPLPFLQGGLQRVKANLMSRVKKGAMSQQVDLLTSVSWKSCCRWLFICMHVLLWSSSALRLSHLSREALWPSAASGGQHPHSKACSE